MCQGELTMSSIINKLRNFFFKCELWKNCELYTADSWYCIEDGGDHCGKAKRARHRESVKKRSNDFGSLEAIFEEPQEVAGLRIKKKEN